MSAGRLLSNASKVAPDTTRDRGHWLDEAACAGHDPELWYAENWHGQGQAQKADRAAAVEHARSICRTCPVQVECHEDSQTHVPDQIGRRGDYGIRAGLTYEQREGRCSS